MIDITQTLQTVQLNSPAWSSEKALCLAEELNSSVTDGSIDWDGGAGEAWARVVQGGRVVVLISVAVPLALAEGPLDEEIVTRCPAAILEVGDLEAPVLSVDLPAAVLAFGSEARLRNLDPAAFSALDLWYATV